MNIEDEYRKKVAWYESSRRKKNATGREAVLQFLLENPTVIWWWAWELIGQTTIKGAYLSHRAPARASDLAIHEPELVEHRKIGRFKIYRLRWENLGKIKVRLGIDGEVERPKLYEYKPVMIEGVMHVRPIPIEHNL